MQNLKNLNLKGFFKTKVNHTDLIYLLIAKSMLYIGFNKD